MKDIIEAAFEDRANLNPDSATKEVKDAVNEAIYLLDSGKARVAERQGVGDWRVNEWLKKAEAKVEEMCKKLLANLVIEDFKIIGSQ